jgi:hypothetical protein
LARFCLGTWSIFIWEFGRFLFGNLARFRLGTWHFSSLVATKKSRSRLRDFRVGINLRD